MRDSNKGNMAFKDVVITMGMKAFHALEYHGHRSGVSSGIFWFPFGICGKEVGKSWRGKWGINASEFGLQRTIRRS